MTTKRRTLAPGSEVVAVLSDPQILTLTLWGEARGEDVRGQVAVGSVIRNRFHDGRWGGSYADVCLAPWQFSCWRPEGGKAIDEAVLAHARHMASQNVVPEDQALRQCAWVAHGIIGAWLADLTKGATHYYSPKAMVPKGSVPAWARDEAPIAIVGDHLFFKGIK